MLEIILIMQVLILSAVGYLVYRASKKTARRLNQQLFVDTSVLIDGRIRAVAQAGFIGRTLVIPRSVIGELQLLADGSDGEKRQRARHGLDVISELQALESVDVEIFPDDPRTPEGVDERLLSLVKAHGGALCTIDYNLNKVAHVEGLRVANINELAKNLRIEHLPGEKVSLALTTTGNDSTQAVGHLDDGTMVVVEKAKSKIGTVVEVEIIRSLQTDAGRMLFARLLNKSGVNPSKDKSNISTGQRPAPRANVRNANSSAKPVSADKKTAGRKPINTRSSKEQTPSRNQSRTRKNREDDLIALINE